jgi:hypothetical protein
MRQVKFYRGTAEQFGDLQDVDPYGLYFISYSTQVTEEQES